MGTNYYYHYNICSYCGRSEELHIGKSSGGWYFALHVYPEKGINDLDDWKKLLSNINIAIKNEYGESVSFKEMINIITKREWHGKNELYNKWYIDNHAEPGCNGLARSTIDGIHCIGHGLGTWDLMIGDFS